MTLYQVVFLADVFAHPKAQNRTLDKPLLREKGLELSLP
jgi:hypothetical protein